MPTILRLTVKDSKPVLRGWDFYWSLMMDRAMKNEAFSVRDIDQASNGRKADVRDFFRRLLAAGFIEKCTPDAPQHYRVLRKQSATPSVRRDGTVIEHVSKNQAMWNTMRSSLCQAGFTMDDLVNWGSTDEQKISRESAKSYIKRLAGVGYLLEVQKGGATKLSVWRLLPDMNSGPKAPKILRSHVVFDPNREKLIGEVVAEEDAI